MTDSISPNWAVLDAHLERRRAAEEQRKAAAAAAAARQPRVIARYLTAAGTALADRSLVVEVIETDRGPGGGIVHETKATCSVCPARERVLWEDGYYTVDRWVPFEGDEGKDRAGLEAREWAQDHAATCRALPVEG